MALANYLYPHSATCVTEKSCVILVYPLGTASFVYVQHHYSVTLRLGLSPAASRSEFT